MEDSSSLDQVRLLYRATRDCYKVVGRTIAGPNENLLQGTDFVGQPRPEAQDMVNKSRGQASDFAVLLLWATFERYIIDFVQQKSEKLREETPPVLAENLHQTEILSVVHQQRQIQKQHTQC